MFKSLIEFWSRLSLKISLAKFTTALSSNHLSVSIKANVYRLVWSIPRGMHFFRKFAKILPNRQPQVLDKASSRAMKFVAPFTKGKPGNPSNYYVILLSLSFLSWVYRQLFLGTNQTGGDMGAKNWWLSKIRILIRQRWLAMLIDVALNVFAIFEPANPSLEFDNSFDTRTLHDNTITSKNNNCNLAIKKTWQLVFSGIDTLS